MLLCILVFYSDDGSATKDAPVTLRVYNEKYFKSRTRIFQTPEHANSSFIKSDKMTNDYLDPSNGYVTLSTRQVRCMNYVVVHMLSTCSCELNM